MGNCLKHQSSAKYATENDGEDDWDLLAPAAAAEDAAFAASNANVATGKSKTTTEVKIKITKKQLEELLGKVEVKDLRVEQVLAQLMTRSGGYQSLQRPWRPALRSIPEVN